MVGSAGSKGMTIVVADHLVYHHLEVSLLVRVHDLALAPVSMVVKLPCFGAKFPAPELLSNGRIYPPHLIR